MAWGQSVQQDLSSAYPGRAQGASPASGLRSVQSLAASEGHARGEAPGPGIPLTYPSHPGPLCQRVTFLPSPAGVLAPS